MFWLDHSQNYISIHPPRVGRDVSDWALSSAWGDISIHPPRVGRDTR